MPIRISTAHQAFSCNANQDQHGPPSLLDVGEVARNAIDFFAHFLDGLVELFDLPALIVETLHRPTQCLGDLKDLLEREETVIARDLFGGCRALAGLGVLGTCLVVILLLKSA